MAFGSTHRTRLRLLFRTEPARTVRAGCTLMKSFFGCIAIVTEAENGKIRVQNAKFVGKRIT